MLAGSHCAQQRLPPSGAIAVMHQKDWSRCLAVTESHSHCACEPVVARQNEPELQWDQTAVLLL